MEKRKKTKNKKEEAVDLKDEGNQAFKQGDLQEALDCYTLSLAADASVFQTYCNRAMVLLKLDRPVDAQADAEKSIKLAPKFTKGYMRRGTRHLLEFSPHPEPCPSFSHLASSSPSRSLLPWPQALHMRLKAN